MSDIALLAPDVGSALADRRDLQHQHEALAAANEARLGAAAELRAEAARRMEGSTEGAGLLAGVAERLESGHVSGGVDRLVHELLGDLLADALHAGDEGCPPHMAARAFALRALARHDPLWPGAGPRLGCPYGYESVLAVVRRSAGVFGA